MIKDTLFWERYRPTTLKSEKGKIPMILLPRIKKVVDGDLDLNLVFYGSGGTGKTTLAGILTQNTNCLKLNGSIDGKKDTVGDIIEEHCRLCNPFKSKSSVKTVWIEEFDGTTPHFRRALRAFMEDFKNVRFIITLNNLSKISKTKEDKAFFDRLTLINFDPINKEEEGFLKERQVLFLKSITNNLKFDVDETILRKLIDSSFPCFRKTVQLLQELYITQDFQRFAEVKDDRNDELYNFILNGENSVQDNFEFVLKNYGDNTEQLLLELGRPFFKYIREEQPNLLSKSQNFIKLVKDYGAEYHSIVDPEMHLISFVTELKEIMNK